MFTNTTRTSGAKRGMTSRSTPKMARLFFSLLLPLLSIQLSLGVSRSGPDSGGCVYSFQVWRPNQDVLEKLKGLEQRCSNSTMLLEQQILGMRNQLLEQMLESRNITHRLEKELLQQKLEEVQMKIIQKDVRLELVEAKSLSNKMNSVLQKLQSESGKLTGSHKKISHDNQRVRHQMDSMQNLMGRLKNGVGDLKAEWLLIKREVADIKSENVQLKYGQNDLKMDSTKLKNLIEDMQSDTVLLKNQQNDITSQNGKLKKSIDDVKQETVRMKDDQQDIRSESVRLQREVLEMKAIGDQLQDDVSHMQDENTKIIALALSSRNMTNAEINDWLSKIPVTRSRGHSRSRARENATPSENEAPEIARDCHDIYKKGYHVSGVYQIKPDGMAMLDNVYCEMLNNTGWTLISRRNDGTLNFNRRWLEYKYGFGNLYGEFWLGNEWLSKLTNQGDYTMRIDMWDWEGARAFAEYDVIKVDTEVERYRLHVGTFSGNAGDSLSYHDKMAFSTEDMDNDLFLRNCAAENKGGWWYNSCYSSNINGAYQAAGWYSKGPQTFADGVVWYTLKESEFYSLRRAEIKLRPAILHGHR